MSNVEAVLFLFIQDVFLWSHAKASIGFAYIGLLMAFTQGFLVRRWIPSLGERKVHKIGMLFSMTGFLFIVIAAIFKSFVFFVFGVTVLSVGYSLSNTCLAGAVSLLTKSGHQGKVFGVQQSVLSFARILGPALGGALYQFYFQVPFVISLFFVGVALFFTWSLGFAFPGLGKSKKQNPNTSTSEVADTNPAPPSAVDPDFKFWKMIWP